MSERTVRLTREELYDLVWSKPMTTIAAEFGMSSVAFAKYCKELDVPRPGRGYWRQVGSGQEPSRDKLPKATTKLPAFVVIEKYPRPGLGRRPPRDLPPVAIPERIARLHPVAKQLDELLRPDRHHDRMMTIRGDYRPILKVGETTRRRALRLLHTIFHTVEEHGHQVRLRTSADETPWLRGRSALAVVVDGDPIAVSLREHLTRLNREPNERERRWPIFARKYDLKPSGELILELHIPWGADTRTRWRDSEKGRLEDVLGEILWAIKEAAHGLVVHRA
jgi:hypothetical protein